MNYIRVTWVHQYHPHIESLLTWQERQALARLEAKELHKLGVVRAYPAGKGYATTVVFVPAARIEALFEYLTERGIEWTI